MSIISNHLPRTGTAPCGARRGASHTVMGIVKRHNSRRDETHDIVAMRIPKSGRVDLRKLKSNQSVACGDMQTFYFLLTKKA
jgi:hypothetical protein